MAIFAAMVALFSAVNPRFFSLAAAANILQDFSPVVLMAAGQTFVIASGGIDLSVGSVLGLAGVAMALVIRTLNDSGFRPRRDDRSRPRRRHLHRSHRRTR